MAQMASGDSRATLISRRWLAAWGAVAVVLAAWLSLAAPSGALALAGARAPGSTAGQPPSGQLARTLRALERRGRAAGTPARSTPGADAGQPSNGAGGATSVTSGAPTTGGSGGAPASTRSPAGGAAGVGAPGTTTPATTTTTTTTATPGTTPTTPATTGTSAAHPHASSSSPSTPAIVIAVIAAILVLLSLAWALARALAYEPSWMPSLRHSFAEAGFRASATFAELGDWLRLGR